MTTYSIPSGLRIRSNRWGLQTNTQVFTSPLNRSTQRLVLSGARWVATYTLTPYLHSETKLDEVKAFLLKLQGGGNTFYGYDPDRKTPKGTATGTPLINGAFQSGGQINTDGWTGSVTGIMKAGDYFTVNGELKMVTADANSDSGGNAVLYFQPILRNMPADNAAITVTNPTCTMRLIDDDQSVWESNYNKLTDIVFSGVETWT